jgi:hypothetical protein
LTDETRELELRRFFYERLVPAAMVLRERGVEFFALAPARAASSYWQSRQPGEGYVFQIGDDLAGEVHAMWRQHPELQALANELAEMSRELADRREPAADVSSFIYAMF